MKLPEVEIDNEWINCCEPLNSLKWTDKERELAINFAYYNLCDDDENYTSRKYFIVP
jgi:hypothetical protein